MLQNIHQYEFVVIIIGKISFAAGHGQGVNVELCGIYRDDIYVLQNYMSIRLGYTSFILIIPLTK